MQTPGYLLSPRLGQDDSRPQSQTTSGNIGSLPNDQTLSLAVRSVGRSRRWRGDGAESPAVAPEGTVQLVPGPAGTAPQPGGLMPQLENHRFSPLHVQLPPYSPAPLRGAPGAHHTGQRPLSRRVQQAEWWFPKRQVTPCTCRSDLIQKKGLGRWN